MQQNNMAYPDPYLLLDRSRAFNDDMVALLDTVIEAMFDGTSVKNRETAHKILEEFKSIPDSWKHVALILSKSSNVNTKFFSLQVLQICIQTRWNILPPEERAGIKQYVSEFVIKLSMDDEVCNKEKHFLTKMNECLIQIVKKEWPDRWPNFISEICKASHVSQNICENNMRLLNMLSEEIFDFGEDSMESRKVKKLASTMTAEFREIYNVCLFVLNSFIQSPEIIRPSLVAQTLVCLAHFLKWIPYGYIFEAYVHNNVSVVLIDLLLDHFWDPVVYRIESTKCITEIASLSLQGHELHSFSPRIAAMWPKLVAKISQLPASSMQYDDPKNVPHSMRLFWESFYMQLSLCLTNFLRNFQESVIEKIPDSRESLLFILERLVLISDINHEETFKITVDFWHHFSYQIFKEIKDNEKRVAAEHGMLVNDGNTHIFNPAIINLNQRSEVLRYKIFEPILVEAQKVLIKKMAKPQEIYIMYDTDSREVVREYNPNTAEIALYNKMKSTQIYLTNMLQQKTEQIMKEILKREMEYANVTGRRESWDPTALNRLCYTVGSVTSTLEESFEKQFLVWIIKCLLSICEIKVAIGDKAIVASNIMYVVGQYPQFLKTNWRFLSTVLNKLFEFMRETFPGVQQMACETFLKITSSCKKVIASQSDGNGSYIRELIQINHTMTSVLDEKLILWFYESVGNVISAAEISTRGDFIENLMSHCNNEWNVLTSNVNSDTPNSTFYQVEVSRPIIQILKINNRVAKSTGFSFTKQLLHIYPNMVKVYNLYTQFIQHSVQQYGIACFKHNNVNTLHLAKRSMLHLLETYITNIPSGVVKTLCNNKSDNNMDDDLDFELSLDNTKYSDIIRQLLDSIINNILLDYKMGFAEIRDHEVLCMTSAMVEKLGNSGVSVLPQIFENVFDCTLDMMKDNFHAYPDHRESFYDLLQKATKHCFDGLLILPNERLASFVMSLIWAFKHEHPAVAEKGLLIVLEFLRNLVMLHNKTTFAPGTVSPLVSFCIAYYYLLLKEILGVLTDTLHKSGFRLQTQILKLLVKFIESDMVNDPTHNLTNISVMRYLVDLIGRSFNSLHTKQIDTFVVDLFNYASCVSNDIDEPGSADPSTKFQTHVRDFLLSLKEFAGSGEEFEMIFEKDRQDAIQRARNIEMKKNQLVTKEVMLN